ncbi:MAG: hypothetical protein J6P48_01445 [Oscillospiraceae bacterium]|nr:hypothetical protein [Oscillospiraceae bacterium]
MGILPEVKCRRCGESFSALRSRCPNCGTRRASQSTRTPSPTPSTVQGTEAYSRANTNSRWQLLFGLILVAAVILSVVVMVSTGLTAQDVQSAKPSLSMPTVPESAALVETAPTPPPTPTPTIEALKVYFYTNDLTNSDFTMRLSQGEEGDIKLKASAFPLTIENPRYNWSVDQDGIIELTPNEDGSECLIHQVGVLQTGVVITVECFGMEVTVRCHAFE